MEDDFDNDVWDEGNNSKVPMTQRCRLLVWAHPGLTGRELSEITGVKYYVLERRLSDLRNSGMVKNGPERKCRITNKICLTWFPAGEGADEYIAKCWKEPEPLRRDQMPWDPALRSPPDPETDRLLEQGPLHKWITRENIEETKRVWSPYYGYALTDDDAIQIMRNVKWLAEALVKNKESKKSENTPQPEPTKPAFYDI